MNTKEKYINYIMTFIIVILVLFIIYLLFMKNDLNQKFKPSGNIDIFDIICDYDCNCNNDKPVFGVEDGFNIIDNDFLWEMTNNINIFSNPMYEMDNKIAPNSTNFYQFIVRNNTDFNIMYDIIFAEENTHNINMKYRLIKNNEYVIGNEEKWVTSSELSLYNIELSSKEKNTYYLEWKWFEGPNDTIIGETAAAGYSLNISIKAVVS